MKSISILSHALFSSSFHADLQGGERNEIFSNSTSESLLADDSDVMSTHSDTTLTRATVETVSLADYALMGEEFLSNLSGSPLSRPASGTTETNVGMHFSQLRGKSLSLESLATSPDSKGGHQRKRKKLDLPVLQIQNSPSPPKTERVPIVITPNVPFRNANVKSNLFGKNSVRRVKSLDTPRTSLCSGEEKVLQKRSRYNTRLEFHYYLLVILHQLIVCIISEQQPWQSNSSFRTLNVIIVERKKDQSERRNIQTQLNGPQYMRAGLFFFCIYVSAFSAFIYLYE